MNGAGKLWKRWFDQHDNNKATESFVADMKSNTCDEVKKYVIERFFSKKGSFRWDFVAELIQKYENERPEEIGKCVDDMYELLMQRKDANYWGRDGATIAFKAIFRFLDKDKIKAIFNKIVLDYFSNETNRYDTKLFYLNNDLENFTYCYYQTLTLADNINALKIILEMHSCWLTGNGTLPLKIYYKKDDELDVPSNWIHLCKKIEDKQK